MTQVLPTPLLPQEHSKEPPSPTAVSSRNVEEALRLDKGEDALLTSWTTKDFLSKGDNYVSIITSVVVQFRLGEEEEEEDQEVTYVVKMKQMKENGSASDFDNMVFNKEGKFYSQLLPLLNSQLESIDQETLKLPRFLHQTWREEQYQLFLEDLRPLQFKLFDRRKGLDAEHTKLVLKELSKLHASSYLLQIKDPDCKISQEFSFLDWEWFTYSEKSKGAFDVLVTGGLQTAALLAKELGKENVSHWYNQIASDGVKILAEQLECNSPGFNVIGHGDCWVNNLLFKYNSEGEPVDLMLIDLQICRQSNLALDLNYFFFTSLDRSERRDNLKDLLSFYYTSFSSILQSSSEDTPFTIEELEAEYRRTNVFGLIMGTLLMPNILCDPADVQDFDAGSDGCAKGYVEKKRDRTLRMLKNNAVFRQRITEVFDDITEIMDLT